MPQARPASHWPIVPHSLVLFAKRFSLALPASLPAALVYLLSSSYFSQGASVAQSRATSDTLFLPLPHLRFRAINLLLIRSRLPRRCTAFCRPFSRLSIQRIRLDGLLFTTFSFYRHAINTIARLCGCFCTSFSTKYRPRLKTGSLVDAVIEANQQDTAAAE